MIQIQNFINNEFVPAQNGCTLDDFDPSRGSAYAQFPDSDELDAVMAIQAAKKAYEPWSETAIDQRAEFLLNIAERLEARQEEFAVAESRDVGKPLQLARDADLVRAIAAFRYFAQQGQNTSNSSWTSPDHKGLFYTLRQPLGVAGLITPWNYPLYLLCWKLAPALICGNTTVCKPSELTPMTAKLLCEVILEVGLPAGVVNVVHGKGEVVGQTLVSHPSVPLISFTGGTDTGAKIQELAARHTKKVSLELGGKNPILIFKDADLKKVIPATLRSSFMNSGQVCLSGSRIFVHEPIYDEFAAEFKRQTEALKVGDPANAETYMGPLISADHLAQVKSRLQLAEQEKGQITCGGEAPTDLPEEFNQGYFLRPTIIEDLTDCSELHQTEVFGPVVTLRPFKYPHEAVKWANTSPYGLAASVWTKDITRAHKVAAQIQAGTVWINQWGVRDLRVPFGGVKASGIGREGGDLSLDFYSEKKTVFVQL